LRALHLTCCALRIGTCCNRAEGNGAIDFRGDMPPRARSVPLTSRAACCLSRRRVHFTSLCGTWRYDAYDAAAHVRWAYGTRRVVRSSRCAIAIISRAVSHRWQTAYRNARACTAETLCCACALANVGAHCLFAASHLSRNDCARRHQESIHAHILPSIRICCGLLGEINKKSSVDMNILAYILYVMEGNDIAFVMAEKRHQEAENMEEWR